MKLQFEPSDWMIKQTDLLNVLRRVAGPTDWAPGGGESSEMLKQDVAPAPAGAVQPDGSSSLPNRRLQQRHFSLLWWCTHCSTSWPQTYGSERRAVLAEPLPASAIWHRLVRLPWNGTDLMDEMTFPCTVIMGRRSAPGPGAWQKRITPRVAVINLFWPLC